MEIVGDEKILSRGIVDARVETDRASARGIVAKVDAAYLVSRGINSLDLGGTEVVVKVLILGVGSRAAFSTIYKNASSKRFQYRAFGNERTYQRIRTRIPEE